MNEGMNMEFFDDYDMEKARIQGYRDCLSIIRNMANRLEFDDGRPQDAKVLRDAMSRIDLEFGRRVKANYDRHPDRYIAGLMAEKDRD
jgi:hypothetical protein